MYRLYGVNTPVYRLYKVNTPVYRLYEVNTPVYRLYGVNTPVYRLYGVNTPVYRLYGVNTPVYRLYGVNTPVYRLYKVNTPVYRLYEHPLCWLSSTSRIVLMPIRKISIGAGVSSAGAISHMWNTTVQKFTCLGYDPYSVFTYVPVWHTTASPLGFSQAALVCRICSKIVSVVILCPQAGSQGVCWVLRTPPFTGMMP